MEKNRNQYFKNYPIEKGMAKAYWLLGGERKFEGKKEHPGCHARGLGLLPPGSGLSIICARARSAIQSRGYIEL